MSLIWYPERGYGFDSTPIKPYGQEYWDEYVRRSQTEIGRKLHRFRVDLVKRYWTGPVVDVGIGAGQFIEMHGQATGRDVNPVALEWLARRGLLCDADSYPAATYWDVLEHIEAPEQALGRVDEWVFLSLPIFTGPDHVMRSKHYKPGEHLWYWTRDGLIRWMQDEGFRCMEHNTGESLIGREDIHTFVFRRGFR